MNLYPTGNTFSSNYVDWIIERLGGYSKRDWALMQSCLNKRMEVIKDLQTTIVNLQALIPVSAVTKPKRGRPKKRGRPRKDKIAGAFKKLDGTRQKLEATKAALSSNTRKEHWTYIAKPQDHDWQKDLMEDMKSYE